MGNHQPGQSEWVPIPGSWSLPRATLAWGCSPPDCGLLEGWDGIHPWLSSTASTGLHTWWVSLQVFFLNEPRCSPWVRCLAPSSRICSGCSFAGELKREGLSPRIWLRWPVAFQSSIWGGPKASGLPEKEISGSRVCQRLPSSPAQQLALSRWCQTLGKGDCQFLVVSAWKRKLRGTVPGVLLGMARKKISIMMCQIQ